MKVKKSLLGLLLVLAVLFSLMVAPVSAAGAPILTITPSVTSIEQGSGTANVIYTIDLDPNGNSVAAFAFELHAPEGMTLSQTEADEQNGAGYWINAAELMRMSIAPYKNNPFSTFEYAPTTGYFGAAGGMDGKTLDTKKVVMTIQATVDISTAKTYTLEVTKFKCGDVLANDLGGETPTVGTVTITGSTPPVTDSYTVTFDANGGSGTMADATVTKGADGTYKYTLPECGFTAPEGKVFKWWLVYRSSTDTKGSPWRPGSELTLSGDIKLKAEWDTAIVNPTVTLTLDKSTYAVGKKIVDIKLSCAGTNIYSYEDAEYYKYYAVFEGNPYDTDSIEIKADSTATFEAGKDYYVVAAILPPAEGYYITALSKDNVKLDGKAPVADPTLAYGFATAVFKLDKLEATPVHTHSYTVETVSTDALKSAANCQSAAVYYKSCSCGAIDKSETAATFTSGAVDSTKHVGELDTTWQKDENNHWHVYSGCKHVVDKAAHTYGTDRKCVCGATQAKLNQTITAADVTAAYGDTDKKITATLVGNGNLTYAVATGTDVIDVAADGKLTIKKAGTATVTITAAETPTYNQATKTVTVTVNKKVINVVDAGCLSRQYEAGNVYAEFSGASFADEAGVGIIGLTKGVGYTGVGKMADDTAGVGKPITITVTLIGDAVNNYELKTNTYSTFVSISTIDAPDPTGLAGKSGEQLSTVALPTGWAWVDGTTVMTTGEQKYKVTYTGTVNYKPWLITDNHELTVTVTDKMPQAITADDVTATYGDTNKKITATLTTGNGELSYTVIDGDDVVEVDETTGALTIKSEGTAKVKVQAAETADYALGTKEVTVTVSRAKLVVVAKNQSIYVNGTLPDLSKPEAGKHYTITGLVDGDTVDVSLNYLDPTIDVTKTGSYDIEVGVAVDTAKYEVEITYGKLTISKRSSGGGGGSSALYDITVKDTDNGTVTSNRKTSGADVTITLTVKAADGYELDTLTVLDKNNKQVTVTAGKDGKYTFKMPASDVTVKGSFKAEKPAEVKNPFTDVPSGAYYEDAVIWAAEEGITGGTTATTFSSDVTCTRAQAVAFLWRAAGCPAPAGKAMPFTDVAAGSYYYDAVLWAIENGITKGTSETTFSPNEGCTRAQIVTFLWRSQKSPAGDAANPFADVSADAYYADAVLWAVKANVTNGTTDTTFSPDQACTRAQIVTFIYRCIK